MKRLLSFILISGIAGLALKSHAQLPVPMLPMAKSVPGAATPAASPQAAPTAIAYRFGTGARLAKRICAG